MAYYPGQKVKQTNPRRITLSKILLVVGVVSVTYVAITLFPPYWRYYKTSSLLAEESQKAYSRRRPQHTWSQIQSTIHTHVKTRLLEMLKIPERDLHLEVEKKEGNIYITATWKTMATWPLIGKSTTLKFSEKVDFGMR